MPSIDFDSLFTQANFLRDGAKVDQAISAYKDISRLATESHEDSFKAQALHLAGVSAKEAVISLESSYYRDALNFFASAQVLYQSLGDQKMLGALYRDIAICGDYAGDSQTAVTYFQKAIETLEPINAFGELAITYDKLGLHFYKLGQFDEAQKFIAKAMELFRNEPTAGFFRATTLLDSARVYCKLGDFDLALKLATESISWFEAEHPGQNFARRLAQLHGLLTFIYNQLSERKKSETHYQQYQDLLKTFDPLAVKVIERDLAETSA